MEQLPSTYENKLIYVFRIEDETHKGLLKIGETTLKTDLTIDKLYPCCEDLNYAAKKRIDSYTNTAGIKYELVYTELAIRQIKNSDGSYILEAFSDKDVHKVLVNSGYSYAKIPGTRAREWFHIDLDIVKQAIVAVKQEKINLLGTNFSIGNFPIIILRPEQEEAIQKTLHRFKSSNRMLWNAKMRFGKTLSALELVKRAGFNKTIIVTHRPVVDEGWRKDFSLIFTNGDVKYGSKKDIPDDKDINKLGDKFIYFASIQDLRGSSLIGGKFEKNSSIFDINWDLVIVDEAHEGTTTALGDEVIKNLVKDGLGSKTKFLALSGTPFNIIDQYESEGVYTWDYVMEQEAKSKWDIEHLGDSNPYSGLPKLNILIYDLGKLISNRYIEFVDKSFNFAEFFKVRNKSFLSDDIKHKLCDSDKLEFCHKEDIISFLNLITKKSKYSNYPYSSKKQRDLFKHTLWVVPGVKEAKALKELMTTHQVFGSSFFNIVNVAGKGDEENSNALEAVQEAIRKAGTDNYTITITCGKLTTGVSVPEWTAVFMLAGSYSTSASSYLQTIFRVQTPCCIGGKVKTNCFVFDFAPDRTLKIIADALSVSKKPGQTSEKNRETLKSFLHYCPVISIDGSRMKPYSSDHLLQQLKKVYTERAVNSGFGDTSIYSNELYSLTDDDLKLFNNLNQIIGSTPSSNISKDIEINNNGFIEKERKKYEELKNTKYKDLSEEQKIELDRLKEISKNRKKAISILRGLSVRMPMLIYGADINLNDDFKIEDFLDNKIIDEDSWKEFMPKGISKEIFKQFIKYYDKDIFVSAGRRIRNIIKAADELEPVDRIKQIVSLFSHFRNPDKETVLTPWRVVNLQLSDTIGGYDFFDQNHQELISTPRYINHMGVTNTIFKKDGIRILEINSKTGFYPLYIAYSLYENRINRNTPIHEKEKIWLNLIEDSIYIICKTPMAVQITKRTLIGFKNSKINAIYINDLVNLARESENYLISLITSCKFWNKGKKGNMKFSAVVGNPPYQENTTINGGQAKPIYNLFVQLAIKLDADYVSMIIPSRWFAGGMGLDDFRRKIMADKCISKIVDFTNSKDCFNNISISGGVCYFLRDKKHHGPCSFTNVLSGKTSNSIRQLDEFDVLIRYNKAVDIIHKINKISKNKLDEIVSSISPFGLSTKIRGESQQFDESVKVYSSSGIGYISKSLITKGLEYVDKYKVLLSQTSAEHAGEPSKNGTYKVLTSSMTIMGPKSACTHSYIVLGCFEEELLAKYLLIYLKSKFVRFLILLTLSSIHISKKSFIFVPLQDFSNSSDINWNVSSIEIDRQLYNKYGLSKEEINFIETIIRSFN